MEGLKWVWAGLPLSLRLFMSSVAIYAAVVLVLMDAGLKLQDALDKAAPIMTVLFVVFTAMWAYRKFYLEKEMATAANTKREVLEILSEYRDLMDMASTKFEDREEGWTLVSGMRSLKTLVKRVDVFPLKHSLPEDIQYFFNEFAENFRDTIFYTDLHTLSPRHVSAEEVRQYEFPTRMAIVFIEKYFKETTK